MSQTGAAVAVEKTEEIAANFKDQVNQKATQVKQGLQEFGNVVTEGLVTAKQKVGEGIEVAGRKEVVVKDGAGNDYIVVPATGAAVFAGVITALSLLDKRVALAVAGFSLLFGKRVDVRDRRTNESA